MSGWSGDPQWSGPPPPRSTPGEQATAPPVWGGQPAGGWGGQPAGGWGGQPHGATGGQPYGTTGAQPWQPPPPRRGVPVWVVVLVGVLALLVGLGVGGAIGFVAGMGSQLSEEFNPQVGPDAASGGGAVTGTHTVGGLTISDIDVQRDFADDFEATATVTNPGPEPHDGGAIELGLLRGDTELGSVTGFVSPLDPGESEVVELWGFDDYADGVDGVEIRID